MAIYNSKRHRNPSADQVFIGIGQWKRKIRLIYLRIFLIFINLAILICAMLCFSAGRHVRIIIENNFEEVEKSREEFLSKAYHHEQEDLKAQELGLVAIHHGEDKVTGNIPHEHSEDKEVSISQDVEEHSRHTENDSQEANIDENQVKTSNHAHVHVEEQEEDTTQEHEEHSHKKKENGHQSHEVEEKANISNNDSDHAEEIQKSTSQKNNHQGGHGDGDQEMKQEMVSAVNIHVENILYLISFLLFFCWTVFGVFISYDFGGQSEVSVLLLVLGMPYIVAMVLWEVGLAVLFHKMVVWAPLANHHPMMAFYADWTVVPTFLKLAGVAQIVTAFLPFVVYYLPSDYLHEMPDHIDGFQRTSISAGQLVIDAMRTDHEIHTSEKPLCDMFLGKYIPHPRLQAADTLAGGVTIFNDLCKQTTDIMLFKKNLYLLN